MLWNFLTKGYKFCYSEKLPNGKLAYANICPRCGARNDLKCPTCNKWWNKVEDKSTINLPRNQKKYHIECPQCKKLNLEKIRFVSGHKTVANWLLGTQETLDDGRNVKCIMNIDKDGIVKLSNGRKS